MDSKKPKKLYKSILKVEVLSDEPIHENASLESVQEAIEYGPSSGKISWDVRNNEISGETAVKECEKHGTDPDFFMMDYNGNELHDE
jgi:hypothetical protein